MREFPAIIKHEGVIPRRPTEVRRADAPLTWRVVEVLHTETDVVVAERSARRVYRLLVAGPMPYAPEKDGKFELLAVDYIDQPYWSIRPVPSEAEGRPGDVSDSAGHASG
ncbi:hypothetical protein [Actinomadura coerulea]|uniref:hypothetical protein n=1 Tax=Actinomadura coerulea TaxID=46159 RepID=UPI00343EB0D2